MKDTTRRVIAYIAGCLISNKKASAIYDSSASKHFSFSGHIAQKDISVYDLTEGCDIAGFGTGNSFSLFHYGNRKHISLELDSTNYNGYDYDTGSHYTGSVNGNAITLYDYEQTSYYHYIL